MYFNDYNTMDHVVHVLLESVPQLPVRDAGRIMLAAPLRDVAQAIVCPKEQAVLYCERLTSFGLTATLEPAG